MPHSAARRREGDSERPLCVLAPPAGVSARGVLEIRNSTSCSNAGGSVCTRRRFPWAPPQGSPLRWCLLVSFHGPAPPQGPPRLETRSLETRRLTRGRPASACQPLQAGGSLLYTCAGARVARRHSPHAGCRRVAATRLPRAHTRVRASNAACCARAPAGLGRWRRGPRVSSAGLRAVRPSPGARRASCTHRSSCAGPYLDPAAARAETARAETPRPHEPRPRCSTS